MGFQKKLSLCKGLNILFAGDSGTEKTMAANIIASVLSLDLCKIERGNKGQVQTIGWRIYQIAGKKDSVDIIL